MASAHMVSSAPPQIPGIQISNDAALELKRHVANLLERENPNKFPGAQPVSFAREHLAELQRNEYFMCEKTDGIRCLLFLSYREAPDGSFHPSTLLIDRKNNYYETKPALRFPYHGAMDNLEAFLYNTILDGELVNDQYPDGKRLKFYVFDCLAIDTQNMTERPLDKRLGYMQELLFKPWRKFLAQNKLHPQRDPFLVLEKQMYSPYHVKNVFDTVLPSLKHGNDGLIFTCKKTKYEFGTDKHILKWKPPHENTIDFKLRLGAFPTIDPEDGEEGLIIDYDAMPEHFELLVNHGRGDYRPFAQLAVTEADWEVLKSLNQRLDGRIIECFRDTDGSWKYKKDDDGTPRWRDDKPDANHISTVDSVLDSIQNPVTEQDLRNAEGRIMEAVKRLRAEEGARVHQEVETAKKRKLSEMTGPTH